MKVTTLTDVFRLRAILAFAVLFLNAEIPVVAQNAWPGYLALMNGDTITGVFEEPHIKYQGSSSHRMRRASKLSIYDLNAKIDREFELSTVQSLVLQMDDEKTTYVVKEHHHISLPVASEFLMIELIKGPISLYSCPVPKSYGDAQVPWTDDNYWFDFELGTNTKKLTLLEKGDVMYQVKKFGFKNEMADYFYKYPALSKRIKRKELRYEQLEQIVDRYNELSSGKEDLTGYIPGFVELSSGAVLQGKLKVYSPAMSCRRLKYADNQDRIVKIRTEQVSGYRRVNEYYKMAVIDSVPIFLLEVATGPLSLYRFTSDLDVRYHKRLPSIEYGEYYRFYFLKDELFTEVKQANFNEEVSAYFLDAPKLAERIRNRELEYDDLIQILQLYAKEISQ